VALASQGADGSFGQVGGVLVSGFAYP
jgi:hypothetical protein